MNAPLDAPVQPSRALSVGLWVTQALLALTFVGSGLWKILTPLDELAAMIPWAGQVSPTFLTMIGLIDILGGLGVILPSLTRLWPRLTVLAALGCAALMVCAIVFHASRGEADRTPFNVFLVVLSLLVAWGRHRAAPIAPRG